MSAGEILSSKSSIWRSIKEEIAGYWKLNYLKIKKDTSPGILIINAVFKWYSDLPEGDQLLVAGWPRYKPRLPFFSLYHLLYIHIYFFYRGALTEYCGCQKQDPSDSFSIFFLFLFLSSFLSYLSVSLLFLNFIKTICTIVQNKLL